MQQGLQLLELVGKLTGNRETYGFFTIKSKAFRLTCSEFYDWKRSIPASRVMWLKQCYLHHPAVITTLKGGQNHSQMAQMGRLFLF